MKIRSGFDRREIAFFAVGVAVIGLLSGQVRVALTVAGAVAMLLIVSTVWKTIVLDGAARGWMASGSQRYQAAKLQAEQRAAAESGRAGGVVDDILDEPI